MHVSTWPAVMSHVAYETRGLGVGGEGGGLAQLLVLSLYIQHVQHTIEVL